MRKARAAYERVRVRVVRGCPLLFFANLEGIYYTAHLKHQRNSRPRAAAEELKKCGVKVGDVFSEALRTMEESEVTRAVCVRPCHLFSDASLILSFRPFFFSLPLLLDNQGDRGRIINDRFHDTAHSQHRSVQNPRGDGRRRA